ncbi:MAG: hypothetical protein PHI67_08840 [Candidatus Methanomethylophilaceae archaeon]|jgi:hypothetical protein|nr:hypothetical protein [Candidatus Methanomethylophilaceae archaeon]
MNWTIIALAGLGLLLMLGTPATAWTTDLSLSSEGRTQVLTLGSEDGASDGFDAGMDIPLPPPPPSSPFSAHLVGNGLFGMLQTEIRVTHSWNIYVASMGEIDIAWNAAPAPLTMTFGEDRFSLTESGHHSLSSGEYRISIQGAQNPASSGPAGGPGGDSSSSGSTVSETPPAAAPAASHDRVQGSMPLPPATLTPDTPDLTPERLQAPRPEEANQAPGFGVLLTLLGVGVLIFTLRDQQMR